MRHLAKGKKFHRKKGQRNMFFRHLLVNLFLNRRIETTVARAKEIKKRAEKLVTLAKKQDLASRRLLISRLGEKAASELFIQIAPKFKERPGGYLRIIKTPVARKRDGSEMSLLEFVE